MKGRYPLVVILLLVVGAVITLLSQYAIPVENGAGLIGIIGAIIFVAGSCLLAKANGIHPAFGVLGMFVLMGWWGVFLGVLLVGLPLLFSSPITPDVVITVEEPVEEPIKETVDDTDPNAPK